jgi:hypothetical protein
MSNLGKCEAKEDDNTKGTEMEKLARPGQHGGAKGEGLGYGG